MYTIEQFQNLPKTSAGKILTLEEFKAQPGPQVVEITEVLTGANRPAARLYVTNHCYGYGVLPDNFVPCSMTVPMRVAPREGFESGRIERPVDLIRFNDYCDRTYGHRHVQIETLEQLVEYLNTHYGAKA